MHNAGTFFLVRFFFLAVLCAFGLTPGPALAAKAENPYASLAGSATGSHNLKVRWTVENEVPGKNKEYGDEGTVWLVVSADVAGKKAPPIHFEGDYSVFLENAPPVPLVSVADFNFDGYDDLSLVEGWSTRGVYGPIFLFNPKGGAFVLSEKFSELSLPETDAARKRVISLPHSSACESGIQEFVVSGFDTLELVYEEMTSCDDEPLPEGQIRIHKRVYKGGKLLSEESEVRKH